MREEQCGGIGPHGAAPVLMVGLLALKVETRKRIRRIGKDGEWQFVCSRKRPFELAAGRKMEESRTNGGGMDT